MVKTKSKKLSSRRSITIPLLIFAGIVLVLLIGQVLHNYTTKIAVEKMATIQKTIAENRKNNIRTYEALQQSRTNLLQNNGVITASTPKYSSKVDVCYIDKGSGFVPRDPYPYQACYVRYVDLFETKINKKEISTVINKIDNKSLIFGDEMIYDSQECDILYQNKSMTTLRYLDWNLPNENKDQYNCSVPKLNIASSVSQYNNDNLYSKTYQTFDENTIDKSASYIAIEADYTYYYESLVCKSFWGCPAPRNIPITNFD